MTAIVALAGLAAFPAGAIAASAPANTAEPTISGTPEVGQELTADPGTWTGDPTPTYSYQWQRCEAAPDPGVDWTTRTAAAENDWRSVAWGGPEGQEKFVAVAASGTGNRVMTSPDGINWTAQASAADKSWLGVTWGGPEGQEKFVAVAGVGSSPGDRVMTSPDGVNWTVQASAPDLDLSSVVWGGAEGEEKFVAVANTSSGNNVITSPDGDNWTALTGVSNVGWRSVAWGGPDGQEKFVAVGFQGTGGSERVMTSPDGETWTLETAPITAAAYNGVTWGGPEGEEKFVATGGDGAVMTSSDGVTWTSRTAAAANIWNSVTWGDPPGETPGKFVAVSFGFGSGNRVMTSPDGIAWTARSVADKQWFGVTWGGAGADTKFVAVGNANSGDPLRVMTSGGLACTDISGADDPTYTLTDDDEGKKIRVKVTATNDAGSSSANSALTATVDPQPVPENTEPPTITGTPEVGQELTADPGEWSGNPTFAYQWQRCEGSTTPTATTPFNTTAMTGTSPVALAIDSSNNLYTANQVTDNISRIAPDGTTDVNWASTGELPWSIALDATGTYVYTANKDSDNITVVPTSSAPGATSEVFASGIDEANVVAVDSAGNVYTGGPSGTYNVYTVKKYPPYDGNPASLPVTPTWSVNVTSSGSPGAVSRVTGIEVDSSGTVYALLNRGTGASIVKGRISKISADGSTITNDWATVGADPRGFTLASDGFIYTSNYGEIVVSKTDASTGSTTSLGNTGPASTGGIVVDEDGNIYVATAFGIVKKIEPDGTSETYANTGAFPVGLVRDSSGNFFTSNVSGNNVTKIAPGSIACTDIDGADDPTYTLTDDDEGKQVRVKVTGTNDAGSADAFSDPTATVDPLPLPENTSIPTITGTPEVGQELTADPGEWSGNPTYSYQWERCGPGDPTSSILGTTGTTPTAIAVDSTGNVYTANFSSNNVTKITPEGTSTILGTTGSQPRGIAVDSVGNVYTANGSSNDVTKITPEGTSTILGTTGTQPTAIAVDSAGNVYTANNSSNDVTKITPEGTSTILGTTGFNPRGIALDSTGNVYTANFGSSSVTKITPGGTSTVLGSTGTSSPEAIAVDSTGNVYTANGFSNDNVTKITPDGTSTVLGITGTWPFGIAVDSAGNVYTANVGSNDVTRITPDGTSTVLGTTGASPVQVALDPAGNVYTANEGSDNVTKIAPTLNCTDITDATDPIYTLTDEDEGKKVRVKVTGTNDAGSTDANSAPTETVTAPPANTTPPSISGEPKVGETLTANPGEWSGYPEPEFSYQWQRCDADGTNCVDIDGATALDYIATEADTGKKIRVQVTATNDEGESTAASPQTDPIEGPPVNTAPPVASGTAQVGQTLTTNNGTWAAQPAPTFTYQWLRCDAEGENCVDIDGATSSTYVPTSADEGSTIRAQVIATNSEGSEGAIGNAIGPIAAAPAPSGKPKIKVSVKAPKKVKAGKRFTIRVKTTNRAKNQTTRATRATAPTTATRVKTCITLPRGVFVVNPRGGKVSGRKVCWTRKSLAAGKSVNYSVVVRSSSNASGSERIAASASASNSSGASAKAKAKSRVDVVKPKPRPKPQPPTG